MARKNKQYNNQRYQVQQPVSSKGKSVSTPFWFIFSIFIIILAQNLGWFEGLIG